MFRSRLVDLLCLFLGLAVGAVLAIATPAHADVAGARWGSGPVCVHYTGSHPHLASYAVAEWNASPDLDLYLRIGTASCAGFGMRTNIVDYRYAASERRSAWTNFTGSYFPTPCASNCTGAGWYWGADNFGTWGWLFKTPVTIHINTRKAWTTASYRGMLVHELGHSLGLIHTTRCDSVMSTTCFGRSVPTSFDRADIERIYPW